MRSENDFEDDIDGVPVSALLHEQRSSRYGSVPGLDDEELADPAELERQVFLQEWGPVLALPSRDEPQGIRPAIDEEGHVDWGAFGTVDFERIRPSFDKVRYKADRLQEELKDVLIMFGTVKRRLPRQASLVLKYLRMGLIELKHIVNDDMLALARLYRRARKLQDQIAELREVGREKLRRELAWLLT